MLRRLIYYVEMIVYSAYRLIMVVLIAIAGIVSLVAFLLDYPMVSGLFLYCSLANTAVLSVYLRIKKRPSFEHSLSDVKKYKKSFGQGFFFTVPLGTVVGIALSTVVVLFNKDLSAPWYMMLFCSVLFPISFEILEPILPDG